MAGTERQDEPFLPDADHPGLISSITASIERAWDEFSRVLGRYQHCCMASLHLLSCGCLGYFMEHLSLRNVFFLAMSGCAFTSVWWSLEMSPVPWGLATLYLFVAAWPSCLGRGLIRSVVWQLKVCMLLTGAVLWSTLFVAVHGTMKRALWIAMGMACVVSEICYWPASEQLIEADFFRWTVHFSTFYVVLIDFWMFPKMLEVDPEQWEVVKEVEEADPETQEALVGAGAGVAVLVLVPILACGITTLIILCRRSPRICMVVATIYVTLAAGLIAAQDHSPQWLANAGQIPIALIFILLIRDSSATMFYDHTTWRGQAMLIVLLLVLWHLAGLLPTEKAVAQARTCGMLGAMLLFKLWLVVETQPPRGPSLAGPMPELGSDLPLSALRPSDVAMAPLQSTVAAEEPHV